MPAERSKSPMPFARVLGRSSPSAVLLLATTLSAAVLLGAVATGLHDHRDHDHSDCPICFLAKAPICTPEVAPPPVIPASWPRPVPRSTARATCQPRLAFAARAPPAELL
jgi:hypothetical protein